METMKTQNYILQGITILLLLLWIPVSLNKFIDFESFRLNMNRQPFSSSIANIIIYSLPFLEIATAILLVLPKYRLWGFIASTILMSIFTIYITSALLNIWDKIPCGCGLIISKLSWLEHIWFNLIFLALSIIAWYLQVKLNKKKVLLTASSSIYN